MHRHHLLGAHLSVQPLSDLRVFAVSAQRTIAKLRDRNCALAARVLFQGEAYVRARQEADQQRVRAILAEERASRLQRANAVLLDVLSQGRLPVWQS